MAGAFEAFSGFIETGVNAISSVVSDFGDIFLTADPTGIATTAVSPLDFGVPIDELADFGAWEQAGSFAGNATWFDTFNPGDILDAAGSVADGFGFAPVLEGEFGGLVSAAGSVASGGFGFPDVLEQPIGSSLKSIATQVRQDFTGFIKDAQAAFQTYQKFAPVVNVATSALGISNPINQIIQPLGQAVGIAGAAAGIAGGIETGNARSVITNPAVVSTAVGLVRGGGAAPIAQGIGTGVSLYNTVQILGSRLPVEGATPVGGTTGYTVAGSVTDPAILGPTTLVTSNGVVGGTFRELSIAESQQLTRNATLINYLADPGLGQPLTYDVAFQSQTNLAPIIAEYNSAILAAEQNIQSNNANIAAIEAELQDETLTDDRRQELEAALQATYENNAIQQNNLDTNQEGLASATASFAQDQQLITTTDVSATRSAGPVGVARSTPQYIQFYDPESGNWSVFDNDTGTTVQTGLTEQQAIIAAQNLGINNGATMNSVATTTTDFGEIVITAPRIPSDAEVTTEQNAVTAALTNVARDQQTIRSQRNTKAQSSDWRVKLSLAPNSNYLYNSGQPGLLAPLSSNGGTGGVIFPYTPSIETAYKANYDTYDLTHSNYRGYFYKNSYVDAVNLRATFTAQDTNEANYLLAVIHFFRSVTKMFYGQNTDQRGAPPPLVYIKGYGDFQFNNHPCLVSQFNYSLPPDVDYIRAQSVLNNNTNLQLARLRNPIANNPLSYSVNRVLNSGLLPGALDFRPPIANNLGIGNPTYVPTKMEISVSLLPIQSRQQVSKNFSIGGFADGSLLSGGFW